MDTVHASWLSFVNRSAWNRGLRLLAVGALVAGLTPAVSLAQSPSPMPESSASPSVAPASAAPSTWPCTGWKPVPRLEPTRAPSATPSPPPIVPMTLQMQEAWGDVPVQTVRTDLGHGRRFLFEGAATSDGRWLIGTARPKRSDGGAVAATPNDLVMVRVSDGAVRTIARLTTPTTSLDSIVSDGRWVVWAESGDDVLADGVRMRVYDRDTRTVRDLARSLHHPGGRLVGRLSLDGDRLVWGQQTGAPHNGPDRNADAVVREMDLSTGTVTTLAEGAGFPVMAGPWLGWGSTAWMDEESLAFTITNRETGQQVHLDVPYPSFLLHGASAVFSTGATGIDIVCLIDDLAATGPARPILADPDHHYEWLTVSDRVIGFSEQSLGGRALGEDPTQVYDRDLEALVDLPMIVGFSQTWAAGPLVVWATPTKHWDDVPDVIRVVDTRDIRR